MKKCLVIFTIFILFSSLAGCIDSTILAPATVNPSAQPILETMAVIAKTVEGLAGSATAYAYTPTATKAPTNTPDAQEVNKTIANSLKDQLISTFGAQITVENVKFGPIGAQEFTNLYIEVNCAGDHSTACPTSHVIIAIMEACKEKKKKLEENVPSTLQVLTITIFDPVNRPRVVEIDWSDVLAYINGDVSGDVFNQLIRYVQ